MDVSLIRHICTYAFLDADDSGKLILNCGWHRISGTIPTRLRVKANSQLVYLYLDRTRFRLCYAKQLMVIPI